MQGKRGKFCWGRFAAPHLTASEGVFPTDLGDFRPLRSIFGRECLLIQLTILNSDRAHLPRAPELVVAQMLCRSPTFSCLRVLVRYARLLTWAPIRLQSMFEIQGIEI